MEVFTVSFIGHREIDDLYHVENKLETIIKELLISHEYVELLVGRDGDFDQAVSSATRRSKRAVGSNNSALVWVQPYPIAEYENNQDSFNSYYDEIEVCSESSVAHFKSAIQIRNRSMIDRADLVICYVSRKTGGAYTTLKYAEKQNKRIINLGIDGEKNE